MPDTQTADRAEGIVLFILIYAGIVLAIVTGLYLWLKRKPL